MDDSINLGPWLSIKADTAVKAWTDAIAALQMCGQHTGFGVNFTPPTEDPVGVEFLLLGNGKC